MSDAPKPSKPSARKPSQSVKPGAAAPKPAVARPAAKRPVKTQAPDDADEFAGLAPRALPPKVVKKKQSVLVKTAAERRPAGPSDPPSEFLVPLVVIGLGLALNLVTTLMLRPEEVPVGIWVGIRMAIVVGSTVITFGALFLAAQVVEAEYGFIHTGFLKVSAIVLTQGWLGDLIMQIPIPVIGPWFGSIIAWLATYAMFKYFFGLDDMEAIASMAVVRLVHWLVFALAFATLVTVVVMGKDAGFDLNNLVPGAEQQLDDEGMGEDPDGGIDLDEGGMPFPGQQMPRQQIPGQPAIPGGPAAEQAPADADVPAGEDPEGDDADDTDS